MSQSFDEVSADSGVDIVPNAMDYMGGGMAWFDYNNDGFDDLYVTGCKLTDKLYHNNGDGTFTDVASTAGLQYTSEVNTVAVATGDIDNDGDRDIILATWKYVNTSELAPNLLYRNNGDGTFTEIRQQAGITGEYFSTSVGFMDVNLDGFLDIHVGNYVQSVDFLIEDGQIVGFNHDCFPDKLYINNGNNTFTESSQVYGLDNEGCTLAVAATDYDQDGDQDLMVANDFGEFIIPNRLYRNEFPQQQFVDVGEISGADVGMYAMGIAVGDYDEDQDFDYYITNLGRKVLLNQESEQFTDVTDGSGTENEGNGEVYSTGWGTFFWDCNNDSYLDLFVANGHMPSIPLTENDPWDPNMLYQYNFDGTFTNIASDVGVADTNIARGTAFSDYDRDGDLDFGVVNIQNNISTGNEHFLLYENNFPSNNWVEFELEGTICNRDAFGAIVTLFSGNRVLIREHSGLCGSHASQHGTAVHFGLGDIEDIDSVQVIWPGGIHQVVLSPAINTIHPVLQNVPDRVGEYDPGSVSIYPNPVKDSFTISGLPGHFSIIKISIYDCLGQMIFDNGQAEVRNGNVFVMRPGGLSGGVYKLCVTAENVTYSQSIIVQ